MAAELPRRKRQPKYVTKWKLPNLFGEKVVTNQVLPLGFTSVESPPNPARKCDLPECKKCSALWTVFRGCGHSFHVECLLPDLSTCTICQATLLSKIEVLGKTANDAVLTNVDFHSTEDDDDETSEDDDSESDDETETEYCDNEPQDIHILLRRISLWQRAQVPQQ